VALLQLVASVISKTPKNSSSVRLQLVDVAPSELKTVLQLVESVLFFFKKETKTVALRGSISLHQYFSFSKNRAKDIRPATLQFAERGIYPYLGEADPGGPGGRAPQKTSFNVSFFLQEQLFLFLFPEKEEYSRQVASNLTVVEPVVLSPDFRYFLMSFDKSHHNCSLFQPTVEPPDHLLPGTMLLLFRIKKKTTNHS
jgi:hypothetical protein